MNCQEFSKRVGEFAVGPVSRSALHDSLLEHAAICPRCVVRLETERALTAGLEMVATDERKIEAPAFLRNDLLIAFENRAGKVPATVVLFPSRSNWVRWALAAAATIILGFVLFSARWAPKPTTNETASNVAPEVSVKPNDVRSDSVASGLSSNTSEVLLPAGPVKAIAPSREIRRVQRRVSPVKAKNSETQVASSEVKSEFVPLTYLNNATAMESGIVVRVEIAREKLATLGLPFDLERADEIIKADIVLGDDGVARAIRLVQ